MGSRWLLSLVLLGAAFCMEASTAHAAAERQRVSVGGYVRLMARPDLQGGNGRLGYWNLHGRLMNEGPWAALEFRLGLLEPSLDDEAPWTELHLRVEGGTVANAEAANGSLALFRLSQVYLRAGGVLLPGVTWRLGTLETWFGDLGLYDMRPAQIFSETIGLSGRVRTGPLEVLVGLGDSGFRVRGADYSPILTAGGTLKLGDGRHVEFGVGGQVLFEPSVAGSTNAPYATPGLDYEAWIRGEVLERWLQENPEGLTEFPNPESRSALSGKLVGYLGLGGAGPLVWNSVHASLTHEHPEGPSTETYDGTEYSLYVTELTDQRWAVQVGNEMLLRFGGGRAEVVWGSLYGNHWDGDNDLVPSDYDRWYVSTVLRAQFGLGRGVQILAESSIAREKSRNGNRFRNRGDSIFASTEGQPDTEGLEFGDSDTRHTWQGKAGVVLSPLGPGVWVRPALRILYGAQWSSQSNAWGNSFVESLGQFNEFGATESHWHHLISIEAEAWF